MSNKYCIISGGTGGHVFPAVALLEKMKAENKSFFMICDERGQRFVSDKKALHIINSPRIVSKNPLSLFLWFLKFLKAFFESFFLFLKEKPHVVISFGGYTSLAPLVAAVVLGKKIILHEQNAVLGKVNRIMSRFAHTLVLSFSQTKNVPDLSYLNVVVAGNPVRSDFLKQNMLEKKFSTFSSSSPLKILVVGGSQGAAFLTQIMPRVFSNLSADIRSKIEVTQQCHQKDMANLQASYQELLMRVQLSSFFNDMSDQFLRHHLVISRAGASTIWELMVSRMPSILIPYPYAADNHQYHNAAILEENGSCQLLAQDDANFVNKMQEFLSQVVQAPQILEQMSQKCDAVDSRSALDRLYKIVIES